MTKIKDFILNLGFVKDALKDAEMQGGIKAFPLAQKDILETMADDLDKRSEELAEDKLAKLFSVVNPRHIVRLDKNLRAVFIGDERADEGRLANLSAEAKLFLGSDLWKLLYETPKELAHQAMFVSGDSIDDMKKGRSILYALSVQKNIIDVFNNYVPKKEATAPVTN